MLCFQATSSQLLQISGPGTDFLTLASRYLPRKSLESRQRKTLDGMALLLDMSPWLQVVPLIPLCRNKIKAQDIWVGGGEESFSCSAQCQEHLQCRQQRASTLPSHLARKWLSWRSYSLEVALAFSLTPDTPYMVPAGTVRKQRHCRHYLE